jgi:carbon-monoxide dehydrogenase large subunit
MGAKYFGASVPRREDPNLLTGRGRYVDTIAPPGLLHVAFLRSPHAHARIRSIDTS